MQSQSEKGKEQNMPTENVDTKDVPRKNVDTQDVSTKNVDTKHVPTKNVDTKDVSTKNVGTKGPATKNVNAKDVDTKDAATKNVDTKDWPTANVLTKYSSKEDVLTKYGCVCAFENCKYLKHAATKDVDTTDTVKYIAEQAQNVSFNMFGVAQLAMEVLSYMICNHENGNIKKVAFRYVRLSSEFHPEPDDPRAADWLFVINTLNFALWTVKIVQEWKVDGHTGYMALCAAIKRAIDGGKPMWDPKFYKDLSMTDMKDIFRGDDNNDIPRISHRLHILHEVGKVLLESYNGTFETCIESCKQDAMQLVAILMKFPSYRDCTAYYGRPVRLHNKAWILTADILSFFGPNHRLNIKMKKDLMPTIFADYRVPQIFYHFKALVYNKNFLDKLKEKDKVVMHGSREELEIRCCSLMIARYIRALVMEKCEYYLPDKIPELGLPGFDCMYLIDNFLWDYRQMHDEELNKKSVLCKIFTEQY